jgi:hypothetical protein
LGGFVTWEQNRKAGFVYMRRKYSQIYMSY